MIEKFMPIVLFLYPSMGNAGNWTCSNILYLSGKLLCKPKIQPGNNNSDPPSGLDGILTLGFSTPSLS